MEFYEKLISNFLFLGYSLQISPNSLNLTTQTFADYFHCIPDTRASHKLRPSFPERIQFFKLSSSLNNRQANFFLYNFFTLVVHMSQVSKPKSRKFVQKDFVRINNVVIAQSYDSNKFKKGEKESISN